MRVRQAGVDDASVLARLLTDFNAEFESDCDPVEVLSVRFARILGEPGVLALLAEPDHGFALLTLRPAIWYDGPVAQLEELYVRPEMRSGGIGAELIARARELVAARGAVEIHINVDGNDLDTRRFYEREGFVNVEREQDGQMLCYIGPTD